MTSNAVGPACGGRPRRFYPIAFSPLPFSTTDSSELTRACHHVRYIMAETPTLSLRTYDPKHVCMRTRAQSASYVLRRSIKPSLRFSDLKKRRVVVWLNVKNNYAYCASVYIFRIKENYRRPLYDSRKLSALYLLRKLDWHICVFLLMMNIVDNHQGYT